MAIREDHAPKFLDLCLILGKPDLSRGQELLDRVPIMLLRSQYELLVRADYAIVERGAGYDLSGGISEIHVPVDDDRHVSGANSIRWFPRGVGCLHHPAAAGGDDDIRRLHQRL